MKKRIKIQIDDFLENGSKKAIDVNGHKIAVFHIDGKYYAIDDLCTHVEAYLSDGFLNGYEVQCPLHSSRFDVRTGAVLCMPAFQGVKTYLVYKDENGVYIEIVD